MAARTIRRRLHHGDIDGRKNEHMDNSGIDSLNEPLLGNNGYADKRSMGNGQDSQHDIWDDKKERLQWTFLFSQLVAQWAQWLANVVLGSSSVFGKLLSLPPISLNGEGNKNFSFSPSPLQMIVMMRYSTCSESFA